MDIPTLKLAAAEFAKCPVPLGGIYGCAPTDPEHTLRLHAGSQLKIITPGNTDNVALSGIDIDSPPPFPFERKKIIPIGKDDKITEWTYSFPDPGLVDISLFHEAGNQHVRVYVAPALPASNGAQINGEAAALELA